MRYLLIRILVESVHIGLSQRTLRCSERGRTQGEVSSHPKIVNKQVSLPVNIPSLPSVLAVEISNRHTITMR